MTTTYEVATIPVSIPNLVEMEHWCQENTEEWDNSLSNEERVWEYCCNKVREVYFYFFNDLDAIHFKLRWSQYL